MHNVSNKLFKAFFHMMFIIIVHVYREVTCRFAYTDKCFEIIRYSSKLIYTVNNTVIKNVFNRFKYK